MTWLKAEDVLQGQGVELDIAPEQMPTQFVVIARVPDFSARGGTALAIGCSPGVDWLDQLGLLHGALKTIDYQVSQETDDPAA